MVAPRLHPGDFGGQEGLGETRFRAIAKNRNLRKSRRILLLQALFIADVTPQFLFVVDFRAN